MSWLPLAIPAVPLALALITALWPRARAGSAHAIAAAGMAVATGLALWLWHAVATGGPIAGPHAAWLDLGGLQLGVGVQADALAAVMATIVCLLSTLVLAFNAWYMHDDELAGRFPWQFCFFAAAMLGIVLADNLFLTFICWELVGLGSYLLIGFWFAKPAAADDPAYQRMKGMRARGVMEQLLSPSHAQLKAFVMNRVGDAGFLIGIGALLAAGAAAGVREPLTWEAISRLAADGTLPGTFLGLSGSDLLNLAALGVFCGAVGKSAQFPLHTWLPDAMQGPTTASSIIHAATMVAAGVYLVARLYTMFPPEALLVVGCVGGFTCLLAASIACVQWDLKAVLAYSTLSQLGLMFVGLGAGAAAHGLEAGVGHLFAHALFKCLLFLCAGAVIHAVGGHQDMGRLGGLLKRMPVTGIAALLAMLAIIGTPFTTGFYSKDAVLGAALMHAQTAGGAAWLPFLLACAGSLLTAFYMVRWWVRIFLGTSRQPRLTDHAHDPGWAGLLALIALAPFALWAPWMVHEAGEGASAGHGHALVVAASLLGGLLVLAVLTYAPVSKLISCTSKPRWWSRFFPDHSDSCGHSTGHVCTVPCGRKTTAAFAPFLMLLPWGVGFALDNAFNPHSPDPAAAAHYHAMTLAIGMLATGASAALCIYWWLPRLGVDTAGFLAYNLRPLWKACAELWGFDRLWHLLFARGLGHGVGRLTARADLGGTDRLASLEGASPFRPADLLSLDGLIDGVGRACGALGQAGSLLHGGRIGVAITVATVAAMALLLLRGLL